METKEVTLEVDYLQDYTRYTKEEVVDILDRLLEKYGVPEAEGTFVFQSRYEPYEDWLGSPSVELVVDRPLSKKELQDRDEQDFILAFARQQGVPFHEAQVLWKHRDKLKENKVVLE